jgi:hypothetical protein
MTPVSRKEFEDLGKPRRPYVAPALSEIRLEPQEAVLGACKVMGGQGPGVGSTCGLTCSSGGS